MTKPNHVWIVELLNGKHWIPLAHNYDRKHATAVRREYQRLCPHSKYRVRKYVAAA